MAMKTIPLEKRATKYESLDAMIDSIQSRTRLDSWSSLVSEVSCPTDLYAALMAGRPELLRIAPTRPLSMEETAEVYKLLAVLIETNVALKEHAQQVSQFVDNWASNFKALARTGQRVQDFAAFRTSSEHDDA